MHAYHQTYGLPTLSTNGTNTDGPFQFPEKLIPLTISKPLAGASLPVYGDGRNVRDWIHVADHCSAIRIVLAFGRPGRAYNVGARCERTNVAVVRTVCFVLDELEPFSAGVTYGPLMTFVPDRPGHDFRYASDPSRIENELGWRPRTAFDSGLRQTVDWYLQNRSWSGVAMQRNSGACDRARGGNPSDAR